MKFHETATTWDRFKGILPGDTKKSTPLIFYSNLIRFCKLKGSKNTVPLYESELAWREGLRPYYKVYPCIVDALCRLKLKCKYQVPDIPCEQLSVRFATGHEPRTKSGVKILSLLLSAGMGHIREGDIKLMFISVDVDSLEKNKAPEKDKSETLRFIIDTNPADINSVEELLEIHGTGSPLENEIKALATRIALTVCMLSQDLKIITPDVLAAEQSRYDAEKDENWKRNAERIAKKRGVLGWSIGKNIQVSPHFRRPHFALRYKKSPNGLVPEIVPVKFCTIHKEKLTKVPTGHMHEDGTEVED